MGDIFVHPDPASLESAAGQAIENILYPLELSTFDNSDHMGFNPITSNPCAGLDSLNPSSLRPPCGSSDQINPSKPFPFSTPLPLLYPSTQPNTFAQLNPPPNEESHNIQSVNSAFADQTWRQAAALLT